MTRTGSNVLRFALLLGLSTEVACVPDPPLSQLETQIFMRSCQFSSCHGAGVAPAGGLSLVDKTFERLVGVRATLAPDKQRVVPFDAARSFLFEKIANEKPSVGKRMPPAQPLPDEEIEQIRAWINAGAPNN